MLCPGTFPHPIAMSLGIASGAKSTVQSHNLPPLENVKNEQSILEIL